MSYRAPFVVPAIKKHTATVIMAHGLGDRFVAIMLLLYKKRSDCLQHTGSALHRTGVAEANSTKSPLFFLMRP